MTDVTARSLRFNYRNYRGEISTRWATPKTFWFGATEYHPNPQWIMSAFDHDKGEMCDG
jgi:hypothetical protein